MIKDVEKSKSELTESALYWTYFNQYKEKQSGLIQKI